MYYKEDWHKAKERLEAFWQGEIIDRCCVAVFAPRKTSKLPPFPELQNGPWLGGLEELSDSDSIGIREWWTSPEQNYKRAITWFENTYFGGEAIPATYINWGAMAEACFLGSEPVFSKNSVWYKEAIHDWDTWTWDFDKSNIYWKQIVAIIDYLLQEDKERYFIGMPELGNAADILSLMRGMDKLSMDLFDYPDKVKEASEFIGKLWVELHDILYPMTLPANDGGGVLPWMSLWAPGKHDQMACDFSTLISPQMYEDFFISDIKRMGKWADFSTYHLDGPECMNKHLDLVLGIEEIDCIEFTPGAGSPPTFSLQYIPRYQKIQEAGKNLYLLVKPEEIEPLLNELSAKRLFLCTQVDSQDEAEALLKQIEKWSRV